MRVNVEPVRIVAAELKNGLTLKHVLQSIIIVHP